MDRFADLYRHDDVGQDDLFAWAFWERLYGPDCGVYYRLSDWTDLYEESERMEEHARKLINIMKHAGIQGLQYAGDKGWVEDAGGRKMRSWRRAPQLVMVRDERPQNEGSRVFLRRMIAAGDLTTLRCQQWICCRTTIEVQP